MILGEKRKCAKCQINTSKTEGIIRVLVYTTRRTWLNPLIPDNFYTYFMRVRHYLLGAIKFGANLIYSECKNLIFCCSKRCCGMHLHNCAYARHRCSTTTHTVNTTAFNTITAAVVVVTLCFSVYLYNTYIYKYIPTHRRTHKCKLVTSKIKAVTASYHLFLTSRLATTCSPPIFG